MHFISFLQIISSFHLVSILMLCYTVPCQWLPGSLAALGNAVVGGQENGAWGTRGAAYVCRAKYGSSTVYGGKARAGLRSNVGRAECFVGLPDGREVKVVDADFELLAYWPPPPPPPLPHPPPRRHPSPPLTLCSKPTPANPCGVCNG